MTRVKRFAGGLALLLATGVACSQALPQKDGRFFMPDDWLFSVGQPFHYRAEATQQGRRLAARAPTPGESARIDEMKALFGRMQSKVLLLGDGDQIVDVQRKPPAQPDSLLLSASMDKSITAFSAGVAVCEGKLKLETKASAVLPELAGTPIGESSLRDNLMMASGTVSGFDDSQSLTREEIADIQSGKTDFMALLKGRLGKQQGWRKPGERFDYKTQDPTLVGMMVAAAYGQQGKDFRAWQSTHFFNQVGVNDRRIQGTDRHGYAWSEGNTRMTLNDWARLAVFVQESRKQPGCYGDFMRQATSTQIKSDKRFARMYSGYGYFVWTDNAELPHSFTALGYGGQAIVWSTVNDKYVILFSNSANPDEIHRLARLWLE